MNTQQLSYIKYVLLIMTVVMSLLGIGIIAAILGHIIVALVAQGILVAYTIIGTWALVID